MRGSTPTGAAYVYTKSGSAWIDTARLTATDTKGGDDLGASVAISGNTVVVGGVLAWGSDGAAYVFTYDSTTKSWTTNPTVLQPINPPVGEFFSNKALAISGTTMVVGAPGFGGGPYHGTSGSAFFYTGSGGSWTLAVQEKSSPQYAGDQFGTSVASSGSMAVIGAPGQSGAGSAYLAVLDQGTFVPTLPINGTDVATGDRFGTAVALSGFNALVGAPGHAGAGVVYVISETTAIPSTAGTVRCLPGPLDPNGGVVAGECRAWLESGKLRGTDTAAGDQFGSSVALDGTTAVVGAPGHGAGKGKAYVFSEVGGTPTEVAELSGSDSVAGDGFGSSVAFDGTTIVVGAPGHGAGKGRAYVFSEVGGKWTQVAEPIGSDSVAGDHFATSVAVTGTTAVVGAPGHGGMGSGYVFSDAGGTWTQQAELVGSDTVAGDQFGTSVGWDGTTAVVGAPGHGGVGDMYVFDEPSNVWGQVAELRGADSSGVTRSEPQSQCPMASHSPGRPTTARRRPMAAPPTGSACRDPLTDPTANTNTVWNPEARYTIPAERVPSPSRPLIP